MKLFQQIAHWLGNNVNGSSQSLADSLHHTLEKIRYYKHSGQYSEALVELQHAQKLTENANGRRLPVVIALHHADILIRLAQWEEAEALLLDLKNDAETRSQPVHTAYILSTLGTLAQEKADWDTARRYYDEALKLARDLNAAGAEGRALGHLADTYLHENNASFAVYLLQEALPKLNTSGDVELSSYFVGRLGEAMIQIGRKSEGQQLLGRALRLAEHMKFRQYELQWRRVLAAQAMGEGQYEEARKHFMVVLAHSNADANPDYIRSLCQMSKTCLRLSEIDPAIEYARQAFELSQKHNLDGDSRLFSSAALGIALRTGGNYAEAITHLETAASSYEQCSVTDADYSNVDVLRNLAAAQTETANYQTALSTYQSALDYAAAHDLPLEKAGTYRDLGILYTRIGEHQQAIDTWMTALKIYEAESQHARVARLYCDIAHLRKHLGQTKRAMKDYEQALMLLSSADDPETRGIVLSNAATAYVDQGDIETAESFFIEAIKIAQQLHDRPAEATRRGNYGWFLMTTGRAQRSLAILAYALQQSENLGLTLQTAVQTDNIGLAHDDLKQYTEAAQHHERALEIVRPLNEPHWEAVISNNLGHTYVALEKLTEAEPLFAAALQTGRDQENYEVIASALTGQAKIALNNGDVEQAGGILQEAITLAEYVGARRLLADTLIIQSEQLVTSGQFEQALANWNKASKLLQMLHIPPANHTPAWVRTAQANNTLNPGNQ